MNSSEPYVIPVVDGSDPKYDWLWAHKDSIGRYSCILDGRALKNEYISCHNQIRLARYSSKVKSLSTAIGKHKCQEQYLNYLTGDDSVFAPLFKNPRWELLEREGRIFGLNVPDTAIEDKRYPFCLLYAFLIESRAFHEAAPRVTSWYELTKLDVEPKLAHVMSVYLTYEKGIFTKTSHASCDFNHKIVSDTNGAIDFSLFLRGEFNKSARDQDFTSILWKTTKATGRSSLDSQIPWNKFGAMVKVGSYGNQFAYEIPSTVIPELAKEIHQLIEKRQ